ncbi:MAG TPA: DUF1003 domain-containing protein [Chthonomonadaceae bacterium]|nr:DUF1003 domain-containing protein [Chthonomonadaceae bacterium]
MTAVPDPRPTVTAPPTLAEIRATRKPIRNVNREHKAKLKPMDRLALLITQRVGTMGFFLIIFVWTVLWTGYNILASEVEALHWKAFDPFPAFVAYLLISNVIQIFLMPLIMVGQNIQGSHSELRAESDFEVNIKAEKEIEVILQHLEQQQTLLMQLVEAQGRKLDTALGQSETPASS